MQILYYKYDQDNIDAALITQWIEGLPADKQQALKRRTARHKRLLSVIGWRLLYLGLQEAGAADDILKSLVFPQHGKPRLEDGTATHISDFNISHSGDIVVCALTAHGRIGVDIERHRAIEPRRFRRYLSDAEAAYIGDDAERFIEVWTRKEAVIKASGIGLTGLSRVASQADCATDPQGSWYLHPLHIDSDYYAHAATDQVEKFPHALQSISAAQLIANTLAPL